MPHQSSYQSISNNTILALFGLTFLILMNYTTHQLGGFGLGLAFNNATWLGFTLIFAMGGLFISLKCSIKLSKSLVGYFLSIVLLLLPLSYAKQALEYDMFLIALAISSALILFFIVEQCNRRRFKTILLAILLLSALVQTVWGMVQYYLIYEPSLWFVAANSTQPHGTFGQKNVFSSYLAFGSLLAIYFLFNQSKKSRLAITLVFLIIILNAHLTMLAEARTGRVVPIIAVLAYLSYCAFKYKSRKLTFALGIVCLLTSFTPKQWFDIRPNQIVTAPIGIQSVGVRPLMYQVGVNLIMDKPLRGVGAGNMAREFMLKKIALEEQQNRIPTELPITSHIHNEPLQWMVELGVVSGLAFVGFMITWLLGLKNGWIDPSVLLLALPFVGHSLLEFPFYASAPHLFAFAIILALASKGRKKVVKFTPVASGFIIPAVGLISYKAIMFLLLSIASMNALIEYRQGNKQDESLLYSVTPTQSFERLFTHEKYQWTFKRGKQQGSISKEQVYSYIEFLEDNVMQWPEALLYVQLAEMYLISGQNKKAQEIMKEAYAFFPSDEKVIALHTKLNPG
ncbi:Wzy polymerase domain-containing protein [Alteromonas sp. W364]|uniref:PglL family O-oligosaccharyltransferase n=1 Tax=Alteromonas sp. W364 TaxID=3075610 RepID=UPI0028871E06|nr:Wzy polymerase domain-containing protein [Alteromonas sp. W364]MDT0628300.1 Wzy polymerase domain-containing protein [Alteromonas sp. W364]